MDENDDLIRQQLRRVTLLDFTPGRLHDPDVGPEIGILTFGCVGEVEQPLAFALKDVRRLVVHALIVLASFDDETAAEVLQTHYRHMIIDPENS